MPTRHSPGLYKRGSTWHIDKRIRGYGRLSESTGENSLEAAEAYLARRLAQIKGEVNGIRTERVFAEAATRYLEEARARGCLNRRAGNALDSVMPFIGSKPLRSVHNATLAPWVSHRLTVNAPGSVNRDIAVIRAVLNLAARLWRDEQDRPWLDTAPLLRMVPDPNPRRSYVLTWEEQEAFLAELPVDVQRAVLLAVNCGAREGELCALRWEWAVKREHEGREYLLFILPAQATKTKKERLVVPNRAAQSVLRDLRLLGHKNVLTYTGKPITRIWCAAWENAWRAAKLPTTKEWRRGPHNLRHTFGHRLRAAGVTMELRQDLLGHEGGRSMTTHYSEGDISALISASDKALETRMSQPLRVVKGVCA